MNYTQRQRELCNIFLLGVNSHLEESNIDIRFFRFASSTLLATDKAILFDTEDEIINENQSFIYPVFIPHNTFKNDKAILLLHGLNERNWSKYLPWAEYLCEKTGKAVILFPIAYHINRSPYSWSNPRALQSILEHRKNKYGNDRSLSFANVVLSERITEKPIRFYNSGRQSLADLTQLFTEIKRGFHPLFKENTQIDIFAYSIGAFLSQITLMTNSNGLFTDSKLFMFCGGSIFSYMFGESRSIMDKPAFARLLEYYMTDFEKEVRYKSETDKGYQSFYSMISPDRNQIERENFFKRLGNKVGGISLAKDLVIPYRGVLQALGNECAKTRIKLLDFTFPYTHENPFPVLKSIDSSEVDKSFTTIFSDAAHFLAN